MDDLMFERDDWEEMRQLGLDIVYNPYSSANGDIREIMNTIEPIKAIHIIPCYIYDDYKVSLELKICKYDSKNKIYIDLSTKDNIKNISNGLENASSWSHDASFPATLYSLDNVKGLSIRNKDLAIVYNALKQEYDSYYNKGCWIPGCVKDLKREMLEYIILRNIVELNAFPGNDGTSSYITPITPLLDSVIFSLPRKGIEQRYYLSDILIEEL